MIMIIASEKEKDHFHDLTKKKDDNKRLKVALLFSIISTLSLSLV